MNKKPELVILAVLIILFTSLFINVPIRIKIKPLNNITPYENANINEILLIKLLMTYMLFKNTDIKFCEFVYYVFGIEIMLFLITKKSSLFLHTFSSLSLFFVLDKYL